MRVGVTVLPTDRSARVDDLAIAAEERGLDAVFVGDHTHIPARRTTPFIMGPNLPEEYLRVHDPFVVLAAAAARTTTITLGICVYLVAQRDAISTAKQVASLDVMSNGRFELGVGYGWNVEEAEDHGVVWSTRRRRVRDSVLAMRALWTEDEASFAGEFVSFERAWAWPKPLARPGRPCPRVLLGAGAGPRNFAAVVDWADGWFPVPFLGDTPERVIELRRVAEMAGRDPATLSIQANGVFPIRQQFDAWREVGAERVLVPLASEPLDAVLPVLDAAAELL